MLTLQQLKKMKPDTIFATGTVEDSPEGVNMTGSGKTLRWVAVRGGIHDWTIYAHTEDHNEQWIRNHGDKVMHRANIKKLVPCDDEAFAMYRN